MGSLQAYLIELQDLAIPLLLADAIAIFSVICFNMWSSRVRKVCLTIDQLTHAIAERTNVTSNDLMRLAEGKELDISVKYFLLETSACWVVASPIESQSSAIQTIFSTKAYTEIWHIRRVLKTKMNLELFEAMPNLLVGFGLMCTFSFLAIALIQTGGALKASDLSALQQQTALQNLIATAGGKFIVSIAGLFCSLAWNWRMKVMMNKLQRCLNALCDTFKKTAPDNAAQMFMQIQLQLLQEIGQAIRLTPHAQAVERASEKVAF